MRASECTTDLEVFTDKSTRSSVLLGNMEYTLSMSFVHSTTSRKGNEGWRREDCLFLMGGGF